MVHDGRAFSARGRGGPAGSSSSYGRGNGRGASNSRGAATGASKGRGLVARSMTAVPLDYESHVNSKPDPVLPIYGSAVPSAGPSSRSRTPALSAYATLSQTDPSLYPQSFSSQTLPQLPGYYNDRSSVMSKSLHAGIGSAGRQVHGKSDQVTVKDGDGPKLQSDSNYTGNNALSFVKAEHGDLAATIATNEQTNITAGPASAPDTASPNVMPALRSRSPSPLPRLISMLPQSESPLPPVVRNYTSDSAPSPQLLSSPSPAAALNTSPTAIPASDQSPLYFVDVVSVQNNAAAPGQLETDNDESDTEELYPRAHQPADKDAPTSGFRYGLPSAIDSLYEMASQRPVRLIQEDVASLWQSKEHNGREASRHEQDHVQLTADTSPSRKKLTKKAKLQAKRDGRRARKQASRKQSDKSSRQPRFEDSDIEWGSDEKSRPRARPMTNEDSETSDVDGLFTDRKEQTPLVKIKGLALANVPRGKKISAVDLAVEDYLANIGQTASSEHESDSGKVKSELRVNDIRLLQSFANAVSMGEHLTIDDLDDIADIQAEEDDSAGPMLVLSEDTDDVSDSGELSAVIGEATEAVAVVTQSSLHRSSGSSDYDEAGDTDAVTHADLMMHAIPVEAENSEAEDDAILEDMLKSLTKARRPREPPTFESDVFDDLLQAQWRLDRQKKAIKRQERALQRLEQQSSKANAKKAKRAVAHTRNFFQEDRNDMHTAGFDLRVSGGTIPPFHRINDDIRSWIDTTDFAEFSLPPMDKKFRCAIHMLAIAYNLKSKSAGKGSSRHNVLYRTQHSSVVRADDRKVREYLTITSSWSRGIFDTRSQPRIISRQGPSGGGHVTKNAEGAVVGYGADRIASDNIGHQMLARMGWAVGSQIGKTGGIHEPIEAIVKTSKAGLGSGWVRYNRGTATPLNSGLESS